MNELTYSLCGKPVIGLLMFATGLCAFPRPVERLAIPLGKAGTVAHVEFEVPVTKTYYLELVFGYGEGKSKEAKSLVGEPTVPNCNTKHASPPITSGGHGFSGIATPLEITVRSLSSPSVTEHFFLAGSCGASWWGAGEVGRSLASIDLREGKYLLVVKNSTAHDALKTVNTSISMSPGSGK